ncbi:uncharacterized protein FFFS_15836 [Fusarium fujikuroi]|nr:uncharacterized protein FFFS_15836 [Fusarium fujikuroi]
MPLSGGATPAISSSIESVLNVFHCCLTGDLDEGRPSKFLPRHDLAFTEDPSIDDYAFGLRDDENDSLRKAVLVAILGFDRILDVPLAFWRSGAMMNMVI